MAVGTNSPISLVLKLSKGKGIFENYLDKTNFTENIGVKIHSVIYTGSENVNKPISVICDNCSIISNLDLTNPISCVLSYGTLTNKQLINTNSEIYSVNNPAKDIKFKIQTHNDSSFKLQTLKSFEGFLYCSLSYLC